MTDVDMIQATKAYKDFLDKGKKHITEYDFNDVLSNAGREAFGQPPQSFNGAMAWWGKKRQATREALAQDGITIHWNDEFEFLFKEWLAKQSEDEPKFANPFVKLDYYSKKRAEFEALYKEKMKQIGFE